MSGGHFDYVEHRFDEVVDELQRLIDTNDSTEKDEFGEEIGYHFNQYTINKFKIAKSAIAKSREMVHLIDYLVSGDTGEDTFHIEWHNKKLFSPVTYDD